MTDHQYSAAGDPTYDTAGLEPDKDARTWAMFCHLSGLAGYVLPFGHVIAPLVIWQMKKDDDFVDDQGKEALNFQITFTLAMFVSILLVFVVVGILLLIVLPVVALVLVIIAAINANNGERYRYPLTIRFIH